MGVLRGFERRLEGAVEGMFARAFKSGLQPIELAKALRDYCEDHRDVTSEAVVMPNDFRFVLHPDDLARMRDHGASLPRELARVVREVSRERGWETYGPPTFSFEGDDDIVVGRFEIMGRIRAGRPEHSESQPPPRTDDRRADAGRGLFGRDRRAVTEERPAGAAPGPPPAPTPSPRTTPRTQALPAPHARTAPPAAAADPESDASIVLHLEVLDTGDALTVRSGRHTIGRAEDCDLTIDSTTVSRKHAVLLVRGDTWWVFDLGSTNGTRVNGKRASELPLARGDRLRIGSVDLLVREA